MTVSTADLGGMGNGLGLPIANPLYGPGQAALLAQAGFQQNMDNARATTQETQARTNRDIQTLQPDIAFKNAQTNLVSQQADSAQIENDVKKYIGTSGLAAGEQAKIFSAESEAAQKQHSQMQQYLVANAQKFDNMPPDAVTQELDNYGQSLGFKPGVAGAVYGSFAKSANGVPPATSETHGMAAAAVNGQPVPPGRGAWQAAADRLLQLNPDIMKANIEQKSATERTNITTAAEERMAKLRTDTEQQIAQLDPEKASQYFTNRYYQLLQSGDKAGAEQARLQGLDAMLKKGYYNESAAYARQAYNPLTPALTAIGAQISNGKTPPGEPQPQVGVAPPGPPQPPAIGGVPSNVPPPQPAPVTPPNGGAPIPQVRPDASPAENEVTLNAIKDRQDIPIQTKVQFAQAAGWTLMTDKNGNKAYVSKDKKNHIEIPR